MEKPAEEFSRDRGHKDGLQSQCKACNALYRAANREKMAKYNREYYAVNRERLVEHQREYYIDNRGNISECKRRYHAVNRERLIEQMRERRGSQPGGVYRLTCAPTGDVYFGSTSNLQSRRGDHFKMLRNGAHSNPTIRELSKLHGEGDFEFKTLVICDREEALYYEQKLIETKPCCNIRTDV
jgi:predicted GIY-YIG superfamily endonuclease